MKTDDAARLAIAITSLLEHFKVEAEGTAYDGMSLTDTAIVGRLAVAASQGREVIQKDIADALNLPKTTMASAIKRLAARGLVRRETAGDARARVVVLTEAGAAFAEDLLQAQAAASATMLDALSPRDRERLIRLLEKIASELQTGTAPEI